ncbi:leucine-rich repeat domain-containing protein [Pseudomonas bananamidigenes]|uniref:leucine-rich repeat domain-containing protein n=1 Tax=Pseudomonas bananamidigenes TaxID=2843610 RepID=UPI00080318A5|nr:leucine-rich repeat domain-containing protein [Pseudomonas bananamidigenes]
MIVSEYASRVPATAPMPPVLADFWISAAAKLPAPDAQGFRIIKQRRYIELTDGHFVQVARDAVTGDWRAMLASELVPSGPFLLPDQHRRYWYPKDGNKVQKLAGADENDVETSAPGSSSALSGRLISRASVERRVRALYPGLADDEVIAFIGDRLHSDPHSVLVRLEKESVALREELKDWLGSARSTHPGAESGLSAEALASQRQTREKFSQDLLAVWRRESVSGQGSADQSFSTFIDFSGELPHLSARFEWVTELVLSARNTEVSLGRFLDSFPNVRYLILESVRMEAFSPAIFRMRDLQHLILNGNSLRLSESSAEGLSRIETLTLLDLRENPLGIAPSVGFMRGLRELFLRDCAIDELPSGMERLPALTRVDLRENDIFIIGEELFDIPDTQNLYLDLRDNPLGVVARERITHYLENASLDRKVQIRADEDGLDVADSSESSESSDSGVESDT